MHSTATSYVKTIKQFTIIKEHIEHRLWFDVETKEDTIVVGMKEQ